MSSPNQHSRNGKAARHAMVSPDDKSGEASTSTAATTSSTTDANELRKLRQALEEANSRDATAKAALAKSDSVILELRSSIRTLKRQLEKLTAEKHEAMERVEQLEEELGQLQQSAEYHLREEQETHQKELQKMQSELVVSNSAAREQIVGELQVQLDRAHAQILTADMVRKELEDTLEAEQYTWELRVQDQERTIISLQQECATLRDDLEQCRAQWREAEKGWTQEVQELQRELDSLPPTGSSTRSIPDLQERVDALEKEREELQGCLDEAMKELEAVDMELREDSGGAIEPLKHLYLWLLDRNNENENDEDDDENGINEAEVPESAEGLLEAIKSNIESHVSTSGIIADPDAAVKVAELEAQLSVYRGDLKAREESSAELRASLKEAVALLKPLQDAVAKTEGEKQALQEQINELQRGRGVDHFQEKLQEREDQVQHMQAEIDTLQKQLAKIQESSPLPSPERNSRRMQQPANEEDHEKFSKARGKRESERALQDMLRNAQGRFERLHQENHHMTAENEELKERLEEAERKLEEQKAANEDVAKRDVAAELREAEIQQLEEEIKAYAAELERKELETTTLREELRKAKEAAPSAAKDFEKMEAELDELREKVERMDDIEEELSETKGDLQATKEAEDMLTKSLKEALGLLKPLQNHLEIAEREKRDIEKQLKAAKKDLSRLETDHSASRSFGRSDEAEIQKTHQEMQVTVQHLEQENSRLQNALEEVSQNLSEVGEENSKSRARMQEKLVELASRYEVTQEKLEGAVVENHALVGALKQKEHQEIEMTEEMARLQEKIRKSEQELENAKYIATSALMKVEELTMTSVEKLSLSRDGKPVDLSQEFEKIMEENSEMMKLEQKVQELENQLDTSKELNESLEEAIVERDRLLLSLATGSPRKTNGNTELQLQLAANGEVGSPSSRSRSKGVSWER